MLMFMYGIDEDEAFDVLRRQSQDHNIKLRLIAEQILKDVVEFARDKGADANMGSMVCCSARTNGSLTSLNANSTGDQNGRPDERPQPPSSDQTVTT